MGLFEVDLDILMACVLACVIARAILDIGSIYIETDGKLE